MPPLTPPPARPPDRARRTVHHDPMRPGRYAVTAEVVWYLPNGVTVDAVRSVVGGDLDLDAAIALTRDPGRMTEAEIVRAIFLGAGGHAARGLCDAFDRHEIRAIAGNPDAGAWRWHAVNLLGWKD